MAYWKYCCLQSRKRRLNSGVFWRLLLILLNFFFFLQHIVTLIILKWCCTHLSRTRQESFMTPDLGSAALHTVAWMGFTQNQITQLVSGQCLTVHLHGNQICLWHNVEHLKSRKKTKNEESKYWVLKNENRFEIQKGKFPWTQPV